MPVQNTSREERSDPSAELNGALMRVARALLFPQNEVTGLDLLPFAQVRCLQAVARTEGSRMQELAGELGIKLPALSQIVERLVRQELVERRVDAADRRVVRLALTRTAQELLDAARERRVERLRGAVERLGEETTRRLVHDLERLAQAGERTEGPEPDSADPIAELLAQRARLRRRLTTPTQAG